MRLTNEQIGIIKQTVQQCAMPLQLEGIRLFGSRTDDAKRGGDIDLMLVFKQPIARPAYLRAKVSSQIERQFEAQLGGALKVDVLLQAPNLPMQAIHEIAEKQGVLL
jgi:predicted nucleotidyltransferase